MGTKTKQNKKTEQATLRVLIKCILHKFLVSCQVQNCEILDEITLFRDLSAFILESICCLSPVNGTK